MRKAKSNKNQPQRVISAKDRIFKFESMQFGNLSWDLPAAQRRQYRNDNYQALHHL